MTFNHYPHPLGAIFPSSFFPVLSVAGKGLGLPTIWNTGKPCSVPRGYCDPPLEPVWLRIWSFSAPEEEFTDLSPKGHILQGKLQLNQMKLSLWIERLKT